MSTEEADPVFDGGPERPFPIEKYASGEPQGLPSAELSAALGLSPEQPTPPQEKPADSQQEPDLEKKPDAPSKDAIENYSAKAQALAEETYALAVQKAKLDPGYLSELAESKDKIDRRLAEKILSRNPEFGAATVDDFRTLQAKRQAGDDPQAQALAEVRVKQEQLDHRQKESEWETFKSHNAVTGELERAADDIRSRFPNADHGELVAFARGKLGVTPSAPKKPGASGAVGGGSAPAEDDPTNSPLATRMLRGKPQDTKQFADDYLRGKIF